MNFFAKVSFVFIATVATLVACGKPYSIKAQDDSSFVEVSGVAAELAQAESLVTELDLNRDFDDERMFYSVRGNGKYVFLRGIINSSFVESLEEVFDQYPNIKWAILTSVPGSMDDDQNLEGSIMVRDRGINTYVPRGGMVASGGTDLFTAGVTRVVAKSAEVGVHSWGGMSEDGSLIEGKDVPRDNEMHTLYLEYYDYMGVPRDFYWFTLESAPLDNIYVMKPDELIKYGVATEIVD